MTASGAEVIAEQDDAADRREQRTAAPSHRVDEREVTMVVGAGQEPAVRQVDRTRRPRPRSRLGQADRRPRSTRRGRHTGDEELRPQRDEPITALLDGQVPPGVEDRGAESEEGCGEHGTKRYRGGLPCAGPP